jgi:hypothetical protein
MKINKMFNIDVELAAKLKDINASELVNYLLMKHFENKENENLTPEQREFKLKALDIQIEASKKLEELKLQYANTI